MDEPDLSRRWVDVQAPVRQVPQGVEEWRGVRVGVAAPKPTSGLCSAWCSSSDVKLLGDADQDADYAQAAITASELLYELSGRRYRGVCKAVDRPGVAFPNGWWLGFRPSWSDAEASWVGDWLRAGYEPPFWCYGVEQRVVLRNTPVVRVTKVVIDDVEVAADTYRLEDGHYLRRVSGWGWPSYQDLSRDSGLGTFRVEYDHGTAPPQAGRDAAAALALVVAQAKAGEEVSLPVGVTSLVRQGVTITKSAIAEIRMGGFGVPLVDVFLDVFGITSPTSSVWSPDLAEESNFLGGA